jgi:hypothetical protein
MAMNSHRSSHRTKPALAVHTSDRSGDLRGRHAQTPAQITPAGWRDVALRVFHGISEDRIMTMSGGVTVIAAAVAWSISGAPAFAKKAKECTVEWRADKAGMQARGVTEKA